MSEPMSADRGARECWSCGLVLPVAYTDVLSMDWCDGCYEAEFLEPEPTALAWTPDAEMQRGAEEVKRLWPDTWEWWLKWLARNDPTEGDE